MKKDTLWEEMRLSYDAYARNVERDLEAAVELLAERSRASGLLGASRPTSR